MGYLKLLMRPKVIRAVAALLVEVGDAVDDGKLTAEERGRVMKAMWRVIHVYQGRS
jgi:hypothetical protein